MCLILTPLVYLWVKDIHLLLLAFAVYGFFIQGCFSWTPIWLPELFPTRMRATTAGFIFNAPRLISAIAPLIAGTLIVGLGGYGKAATIIGMFYIARVHSEVTGGKRGRNHLPIEDSSGRDYRGYP